MEVDKIPKQASQFWPMFFKQKLTIIIIIQFLVSIALGIVLIQTGAFKIDSIIFWVIISSFLAINILTSFLIFVNTTRPTRDLIAAVIHISGQKSTLTAPNPNTDKNNHTGFRDALQIIYELSGMKDKQGLEPVAATEISKKSASQLDILTEALDILPCGFIALNDKREIIYTNKLAPFHIDSDGVKSIDLVFNEGNTLDAWLDDCEEQSVRAEHTWTRISNFLPNQEGRRFFDVIASYQRGNTAETSLIFVDRTSTYAEDEENLDFVSFAAHELRGPITVIKGYLDVLNDELSDTLQNDQQELFHRLIVSANRLSSYIDNILNTSKYDRRHLKMSLSEDTVAGIYETIKDDMALRAIAQNRLLSVNITENLPTIVADRSSMSEVFSNLIDNAIKYSNEGGAVNVTTRVNGNYVDLIVQDHGIGMPDNVVRNLFQKFYRSHRSRETVPGTGIGLYVSKAIVESHGGIIGVQSENGKGSIFTVSIPIYSTVADKLRASHNSNEGLISEGRGWIKNHSMFRG
jgi:signal transduction histidine kinase